MDPSIADILASVTRAHHETNPLTENGALLSDTVQQQSDLQHLTRAWVSERVGPELLPYPADLMDRVMRRIREQIETIEDRTARMDAGTSFSLVVIQTELERFKFLIRSYLRARIAKIDAHSLHILSVHQSQQQQDGTPPLLSPQELQYLTTHAALLERHYNSSFLSSFPPKLRRLDDRAGTGGVGMIEGPDLDKAVFVRCLGVPNNTFSSRNGRQQLYDFDEEMQEDGDADNDAGFGPVEVSCGFTTGSNEGQDGMDDAPSSSRPRDTPRLAAERTIRMRRGDVWMVRWSSVREAVARGECELI